MSDIEYDISRESLSDKVYAYIKHLILSGQLKGGERVPEDKIARRFGLSRTPIREALRRLDEYGLIHIKPRAYSEVVTLRPEEAGDVSMLREAIERLAVRLLAARGTDEDFDNLERIAVECEDCLAKGDIAGTFEKDSDFHLEIARKSGNKHLYELFDKLDAKVQLLRLIMHRNEQNLVSFVKQHRDIVSALRTRDAPRCEIMMQNHILDKLKDYRPDERETDERNRATACRGRSEQ